MPLQLHKSTLLASAMKLFSIILLLVIQLPWSTAQTPAELAIIPYPKTLTDAPTRLNLTAGSEIVYTDPSLQSLANIIQSDINKLTGLSLAVTSGTSGAGDIELALNNTLPDEGYMLEVNSKIVITGKNYRATTWGTSTLLQAINSDGSIKQITVNDSPDTNYRGLMIDLARQWHTVEDIEQIINMCRLYKINYLHLHLMDNESFTFPTTAYPLLPTPGRSYTIAEMQGLETYSQERGVTIIPEIEVPGHAAKMIQAYPSLFGSATSGAINFARADVRAAIGTIVGEVAAIFQATPYIHMGCDEVDFAGMDTHPDYINAIATQGVGNVRGLFNFFINEMNDYVKAEGKTTLVWEGFDATRTGNAEVDTDVVACPFDNYGDAGDEYAHNGYDVLNTSWYPLYLIPSTYVPAEKIYAWDITQFGRYASAFPFSHNNPYEYTMAYPSKIIGAQTCSWEQEAEFEIPSLRGRICPMSERIWNMGAGRTFTDYLDRFEKSDDVLQAILATAVPDPITPSASFDVFTSKIAIQWRAEGQYPTTYTLYRNTTNNSATATAILSNTTATSYDDTSVTSGQTYYYWIKANNSLGTSAFGSSADGRTGSAALVSLHEPFDYATGLGIGGLNGGTGFNGGWYFTNNNGTVEITNSSLNYPNLMTSGNSLSVEMGGATDGLLAERLLSGSFCPEGSEVWVSFLIKADRASSGHAFVHFGDGRVGKKWGNGVYFGGTNAQLELVNGETNLVVLKIENFNGNDNVHIWTNPVVDGTAPDINDPNRYFTDREDVGTNPRLLLNVQHHGEGRYELDEFRVGDSYDDVLPFEITPINSCPEQGVEAFDYAANTSIDGANGGSGFSGAWSTDVLNGSIEVLSGSLNFAGQNTPSTGNKLRFTLQGEDATKGCTRNLSQAFQNGDEVWMSCLIEPITVANGGFWIRPNGRQDIAIGKRWGTQLAIDNNGSSTNVAANTTYKLVVRYKLEATQTVAHLWINRNSNFTDANADATKTIGAIASISNVYIGMERWDDGVMEIDEFHIGCEPDPVDDCDPAMAGMPCDDNDVCTINDMYDASCECVGTFQDTDNDGTCDANDDCPIGNDCNTTCNLLPQQTNLVLGERTMLIIRGVDPATHTWNNTDTDLATFEAEMDAYLREVSFDLAWIDVEMTPVYNFTVDPNNNGIGPLSTALSTLATNDGYNLSSYNTIMYLHQSTTDFGGGGALGSGNGLTGSVWANNDLSWYYQGNIHETFHAFGLGHAETIEGGTEVFPGAPTGGHDPYHFMGSEGNANLQADLPSYMKYFLGWIQPSEIECAPINAGGCTTYRLHEYALVDNYNTQHKYGLQLGDNLWISYEPDSEHTRVEKAGVLLHHIPGAGSAVTRLLDTRPQSITTVPPGLGSNWLPVVDFFDAAMEQGDAFNWQGTDITFTTSGGTGDQRWVDIELCDCRITSGDDDNDGVCNTLDACEGFDDSLDQDGDNIPDACDDCPNAATNDSNGDSICDDLQCFKLSEETFDYTPNTTIDGANGGSGFSGAWSIPNPMNGSIEVLSGSLNFAGHTSTANKMRLTLQSEDATKWCTRTLDQPFVNGEEVWISCLIQPIVRADGGFWIRPNGRQDIAIGKSWGTQLAIDNNGSGINVAANTTYKLVVRYKLEAAQTVAHLWINRNSNFTDANADATKTIGILSDISTIDIAMERWGDGVMEIDELQVGCSSDFSTGNTIAIHPKVFLQGPYNSGNMTSHLNTNSLIPTTEPYTAMGYTHVGGGGEFIASSILASGEAIVDWVVVELRDASNPATIIATRSALLQADGDIVDVDGVSGVAFPVPIGNYHVAVRHRNHLGVMTATPINMN